MRCKTVNLKVHANVFVVCCCTCSCWDIEKKNVLRYISGLWNVQKHCVFCWALQNLSVASCVEVASPLLWLDYTVTRGMGTSGNVDYRCWPSYSQQGCVLSVHSAREAAYICNSHSQCNSFTLTGQTTWTGSLKHRSAPPFFSSVRNVMFFCYICFPAHFSLNKSYYISFMYKYWKCPI